MMSYDLLRYSEVAVYAVWHHDGQTNGINFTYPIRLSVTSAAGCELAMRAASDACSVAPRQTDEWNKLYPIRLSVTSAAGCELAMRACMHACAWQHDDDGSTESLFFHPHNV